MDRVLCVFFSSSLADISSSHQGSLGFVFLPFFRFFLPWKFLFHGCFLCRQRLPPTDAPRHSPCTSLFIEIFLPSRVFSHTRTCLIFFLQNMFLFPDLPTVERSEGTSLVSCVLPLYVCRIRLFLAVPCYPLVPLLFPPPPPPPVDPRWGRHLVLIFPRTTRFRSPRL